jgi:hypothetical protein
VSTAAASAAALAASAALNSELVVYDTLKRKNAEIADITFNYEKDLNKLETELCNTKLDNNGLKAELVNLRLLQLNLSSFK